jgi:hypothetical protein
MGKKGNGKLKIIGIYNLPNGGKKYVVYNVKGKRFIPGAPKFYAELVPLIEGKKIDGTTPAARDSLLRKTLPGHLERCIKQLRII